MSSEYEGNIVKVGYYIILQRQKYSKLHKVTPRCLVMLGKDQLELDAIIGKPIWTTYKMEPKKNTKRIFILKECSNSESLAEQLKKDLSSGIDNRNIFDDGRSQLLSTEEIVGLRTSGMSGQDIVGQLIENSRTFRDKTEYAQEKYLKKKEKKYFEYVTVRWPTIRLISEIMYRVDAAKILGLRMDTLSQIVTMIGMHSHGTYILYESGCQGLAAAAMMNNIGDGGRLIHIHPGNIPQKQCILAMNYSDSQMSRLLSVNVYSLFRNLFQENCVQSGASVEHLTEVNETGESSISNSEDGGENTQSKDDSFDNESVEKNETLEFNSDRNNDESQVKEENDDGEENVGRGSLHVTAGKKRKRSTCDENVSKKLRWEVETEKAANILRSSTTDGLVIVAREHPMNILNALLPYVTPSRPFVVFCPCREPLLELYVHLKGKNNTVGLRVTETWLRTHQILPSRTHPDILMSGGGGYLLTGIVVEDGTAQ